VSTSTIDTLENPPGLEPAGTLLYAVDPMDL